MSSTDADAAQRAAQEYDLAPPRGCRPRAGRASWWPDGGGAAAGAVLLGGSPSAATRRVKRVLTADAPPPPLIAGFLEILK
eukprot:6022031-Prymnesium_polylepis.1